MEALVDRVSSADLQSLLLDVCRRRMASMDSASLFRQYKTNRFVHPSNIDVDQTRRFEQLAHSILPASYEAVELSPVNPLGSCSLVGPVSQNNILTTIRRTEVCADPANALALECAKRREQLLKQDKKSPLRIRLCSSHRVLRAQLFKGPASFPHFKLLCLCVAGRDTGSYTFEAETLREQTSFYIELLTKVREMDIQTSAIRIVFEIFDQNISAKVEDLAKTLKRDHSDIDIEITGSTRQQNYYATLRYKLFATNPGGEEFFLCDGGFTNWTQQLLQNRKERYLASGLGYERLLLFFHKPGTGHASANHRRGQ